MRYTGFSAEEQLRLGLGAASASGRPRERHCRLELGRCRRHFDAEVRIRRYDGIYRRFRSRAVPLRNSAGAISKWFGTNTDIEDPSGSARTAGSPGGLGVG
jgi:PAS domain-containing protein